MPTINSILMHSLKRANLRLELLLLLTLMSGLLTSIFYRPTASVLQTIAEAFAKTEADSEGYQPIIDMISNNSGTLILGYLTLLAINALLLPLWARAMAPSNPVPADGGTKAFVQRGLSAFFNILLAALLTMLIAFIVGPIALSLASVLGSLGGLLALATAVALLWISLKLTSIAHTVICATALDEKLSFRGALRVVQPFTKPIVAALAFIWLSTSFVNLLLGNLATQSLPGDIGFSLSLLINGATMFLTPALHIGALYAIPGIGPK